MDDRYILVEGVPSIEDYRRLRAISGLTPRSAEAARLGLPNTIHGVHVEAEGRAVGMGRIIGDGALVFQVVDVAVDPAHQGRGLGKAIMGALVAHLRANLPAEAYVSLIADGEAHRLYAQFGFEPVAPASIGMAQWIR
ncbi:MAG TPA: GNAT family N-acetyltransferase [Rubellimicrobium sp.]|jgi:GNAT superfamily N-acetyltransferase|nr:GNAT family N-acetyltransferase [Rubellimicrobium sp.]